MSSWKSHQHGNCKGKLRSDHCRLVLKYLGYDLYQRETATSTFMLRHPISRILRISTSYHNTGMPLICCLATEYAELFKQADCRNIPLMRFCTIRRPLAGESTVEMVDSTY
jgi:hypothetical protein